MHSVVPVASKGGYWSFMHKTLLEYFAARQTRSALQKATFLKHAPLVDRLVGLVEEALREEYGGVSALVAESARAHGGYLGSGC